MQIKIKYYYALIPALLCIVFICLSLKKEKYEDNILFYIVDSKKQNIQLYWQGLDQKPIGSIQNLKKHVEKQGHSLIFAMNGVMFKSDLSPQGLYIENNKMLSPIDTNDGEGNFYLKPNGIFYFNKNNEVFICKTKEFLFNANINFATQSGPMLLINGEIHPAFKKGSTNLNIRNGVGILENSKVIFALSKVEINLYDFAQFFQHMGCKNALYLDGYVSRAYFPEKQWIQTDGNFGVMIGVTNKSK